MLHHQHKYRRLYPWRRFLYSLRRRCNNKNHISYKNYGGRGIKALITLKEIEIIWLRDKAYEMKKPTIDKINNDGNYELGNCRFLEKAENSAKDKRKPILQFDLQDKFIKEWKSAREIEKKLKICHSNISQCCLGNYNQSGGFIWKFKHGK